MHEPLDLHLEPDEQILFEVPRTFSWKRDFLQIILSHLLILAALVGLSMAASSLFCITTNSGPSVRLCEEIFLSFTPLISVLLAVLVLLLLAISVIAIFRRELILTNKRIFTHNGVLFGEKRQRIGLKDLHSLTFTKKGILFTSMNARRPKVLARWPHPEDAQALINAYEQLLHRRDQRRSRPSTWEQDFTPD